MKCAIMQPTYLPWAGYFNLMKSVDFFIYLDDVQFASRSWQQRNRILINGKEQYITIPVLKKGRRNQLINEAETDETMPWRQKHKLTVSEAYRKCPYGEVVKEIIHKVLDQASTSLVDVNMSFIEEIKNKLKIDTKTVLSSKIPCSGRKSEYLIKLVQYIGADTYISAQGSKKYIEEEGLFQNSNINLEYQSFTSQNYPQLTTTTQFIPNLSILDVVANLGFEKTMDYIA